MKGAREQGMKEAEGAQEAEAFIKLIGLLSL
jgi:hypothetical protein